MTPDRIRIIERALRFEGIVRAKCPPMLEPALVVAIICQESAGIPGAVRVERGFFTRYLAGLTALVKSTVSPQDDFWMQFPDLFSASYGLMQIMYPVAIERGLVLEYPTDLCDPGTGIEAGVRHLKFCWDHALPTGIAPWSAEERVRRTLLRYNGGGDATYPGKIVAWKADLLSSGLLKGGGT